MKKLIIYISIIIVLGVGAYFIFFNKPVVILQPTPFPANRTLNDTYLLAYGQISSVSTSTLKLDVIKNTNFSDTIFVNAGTINTIISSSTIIRKFDYVKNTHTDLKISDIKKGDYVGLLINKDISSGYKAELISPTDGNVIK